VKIRQLIVIPLSLLLLAACGGREEPAVAAPAAAAEPADLLLRGGYVYTVDDARNVAQAVAIKDGLIQAVGSDEELQALQGPDTEVIDLAGRLLLPGLHDAHIHIFGIVEPDVCTLRSQPMALADMVPHLRECLQRYALPPGQWLAVDMWNFAEGNQVSAEYPTMRAALDAVSSEHPIILWGNDGHRGAANSLALATARDAQGQQVGLSAQTLATVFAEYRELVGVDESGEPDGGLHEHARGLLDVPPRRDPAQLGGLLPQIGEVLAGNGITSVQDAALAPAFLPALREFEASGEMRFRLQVANRLDPDDYADPLTGAVDVDAMLEDLEGIRTRSRAAP
jgi:predicted amidohydrolase YtcJ